MIDQIDRDGLNELEKEYISLYVPVISSPFEKDSSGCINVIGGIDKYVEYLMDSKRVISDFKKTITEEWDSDDEWLVYYKIRLIEEIRNIKLNKLC